MPNLSPRQWAHGFPLRQAALPMADKFRSMFPFGPEDVPERSGALRCVFNTENEAGMNDITVSAQLVLTQIARVRERGLMGEVLEMLRVRVESATFAEHEQCVRPLHQAGLSARLDLAIQRGCRR